MSRVDKRIGALDHEQVAPGKPGQRLAGFQRGQGAAQAAQVERGVGHAAMDFLDRPTSRPCLTFRRPHAHKWAYERVAAHFKPDADRQVLARVAALARPVAPREVAVADAESRVLAEDVAVAAPWPAAPTALQDGWAVRAELVADAGSYAPVLLDPAPAWVEYRRGVAARRRRRAAAGCRAAAPKCMPA